MSGLADDHELAARIATDAGRALLDIRAENAGAEPAVLKRAGDEGAQAVIAAALHRARPGDSVLSEEAADNLARLDATRVWIVDPLDGTREYSEAGRTDWAVHVALWQSGRLVAGAVALPALGLTLGTGEPPTLPAAYGGPSRLVVSRTRPPALVTAVCGQIGGVTVPMGSAGAKAMSVVRGEADAYLHAGGQYEWDSAAPVAVAAAVGLHASRIDGSPLLYNNENPYLPDLLICRPELAEQLLEAVARA
ncbi:MAG: 3'(2'),5'-bisphosphate nucleotidase CysQ [Actinomycetota bacterium]|nr:3'(2'),5'-bisphosphate nucleotidase CysQ [Actinomycetota bacterium]